MAAKKGATPKPKRDPHTHTYTRAVPGGDPRFEACVCGAARRVDRISDNPCVQAWGFGPEGKTCRDCAHLYRFQQARTWYKCQLRRDLTHSATTDQRVSWPACDRFEPTLGTAETGDARST